MTRRRCIVIDGALPALLDGIATVLRSGGTLFDGLVGASRDGPFAPTVRASVARARGGMAVRDAVGGLARAHPSSSVRFAVAAMIVALDTGAAQAATLDAVARRVREHVEVEREIRALSASARMSATVIVVAPLGFGMIVVLIDASLFATALADPAGRVCIGLGLLCQATGAWWMHRLLRVVPDRDRPASDDLPELADLLSLSLAAGLTVPAAVRAVGAQIGGRCGPPLRTSAERLRAGASPTDVLSSWPAQLGPGAQPIVAALLGAHHDGAPVTGVLDRLASDLRHARRQRATERVQRLPVLLLFPLVACVLPAFVLLTVVPIAIGSVGALQQAT